LESLENDVGHALAGEDVATNYGCVVRGGEEGFGRYLDLNGLETALVEGDVFGYEAAKSVDDCTVIRISG